MVLMKKDLEALTHKVENLEQQLQSPAGIENKKIIDSLTQRFESLEHKLQLKDEVDGKNVKSIVQKLEDLELQFESQLKIDDKKLTDSLARRVDNLEHQFKSQVEISDLIHKIIIKQFVSFPSNNLQLRVVPAVEEDVVFYARRLIESFRRKNPDIQNILEQ